MPAWWSADRVRRFAAQTRLAPTSRWGEQVADRPDMHPDRSPSQLEPPAGSRRRRRRQPPRRSRCRAARGSPRSAAASTSRHRDDRHHDELAAATSSDTPSSATTPSPAARVALAVDVAQRRRPLVGCSDELDGGFHRLGVRVGGHGPTLPSVGSPRSPRRAATTATVTIKTAIAAAVGDQQGARVETRHQRRGQVVERVEPAGRQPDRAPAEQRTHPEADDRGEPELDETCQEIVPPVFAHLPTERTRLPVVRPPRRDDEQHPEPRGDADDDGERPDRVEFTKRTPSQLPVSITSATPCEPRTSTPAAASRWVASGWGSRSQTSSADGTSSWPACCGSPR